jgi:hypothetical protein
MTGFCLCLGAKPTQLGPIDRDTPYLRTLYQYQTGYKSQAQHKPTGYMWRICLSSNDFNSNGSLVQGFIPLEFLIFQMFSQNVFAVLALVFSQ